MEQMLLDTLQKWGYEERCNKSTSDLSDPYGFVSSCGVILQSFENNLANLTFTPYPLIQVLFHCCALMTVILYSPFSPLASW